MTNPGHRSAFGGSFSSPAPAGAYLGQAEPMPAPLPTACLGVTSTEGRGQQLGTPTGLCHHLPCLVPLWDREKLQTAPCVLPSFIKCQVLSKSQNDPSNPCYFISDFPLRVGENAATQLHVSLPEHCPGPAGRELGCSAREGTSPALGSTSTKGRFLHHASCLFRCLLTLRRDKHPSPESCLADLCACSPRQYPVCPS